MMRGRRMRYRFSDIVVCYDIFSVEIMCQALAWVYTSGTVDLLGIASLLHPRQPPHTSLDCCFGTCQFSPVFQGGVIAHVLQICNMCWCKALEVRQDLYTIIFVLCMSMGGIWIGVAQYKYIVCVYICIHKYTQCRNVKRRKWRARKCYETVLKMFWICY